MAMLNPPYRPSHHHSNSYGTMTLPDTPFDPSNLPRSDPMRENIRLISNSRATHDASQLPQQYARPLPRNSVGGFGRLFETNGTSHNSQSEHFLRRKTPNGVLNAAYDGTSVEQMERPHAMKHILIPVSEHFSGVSRLFGQDQQVNSPLQYDSGYASFNSQVNSPIPKEMWQPGIPLISDPNIWNTMGRPGQGQLDSVLNQLPLQTPQPLQYPQNGAMYGFMPQPLQPPFVPTAMGSAPFWPGGNHPVFLPVATQEMGFYPHNMVDWRTNHHIDMHNFSWPLPNNAPGGLMLNLQPQPQSHLHPMSYQSMPHDALHNRGQVPHSTLFKENNHMYPSNLKLHNPHQSPYGTPQIHQPPPHDQFDNRLDPLSRDPMTDSRNFGDGRLSKSLYLEEVPPRPQNTSQRDSVYAQAVAIYVDLIKHLGKCRAFKNTGNKGSGLPIRYPKPPRTSQDFGHPPLPQRHNSTGALTHHRPQLSAHHRHSYIEERDLATLHEARTHLLDSRTSPWTPLLQDSATLRSPPPIDRLRHLRREGPDSISSSTSLLPRQDHYPVQNAVSALDKLTVFCEESSWTWIEGMLLGGSMAYALADYHKAYDWYSKILAIDSRHVEAITNLAATLMAMNKKKEAEQYWQKAVKLRPGKFDAVEHLIALLCNESRNGEAIATIEFIERSLRCKPTRFVEPTPELLAQGSYDSPISEPLDKPFFDYEKDEKIYDHREFPGSNQPGFGSSGYAVPGTENGRIHTLVHARGNLLYASGDTVGAAKAFEEAVLITVGRHFGTIDGLVRHILGVLSREVGLSLDHATVDEPLLLPPTFALETLKLCFPPDGNLPGLRDLAHNSPALKNAIGTTSNSLLSLAKIFQDGMASSNLRPMPFKTNFGVREILALYYLSLSLQKSPSTANNVGILLAGLQQTTTPKMLSILAMEHLPSIPGVIPGTGISLALAYYNFGLNLDRKHAHLYTNLGSLLKDLGQLNTAIKMYEEAVKCDQKFDIALANLANAVKDQGRIADAINYYQRAVDASPDFAEAVCGLANALNSVCGWQGRGGIAEGNGLRDRWHVDQSGMLMDATKPGAVSSGWIKRVVDLVEKQLNAGERWGAGIINSHFINQILRCMALMIKDPSELEDRAKFLERALRSWSGSHWEGQRVVRLIERVIKRLTWQWYQDIYVTPRKISSSAYERPVLPQSLSVPAAPTVLPFHTFTSPMSAKQIRQISQRNGLRISVSTLKAAWLPTLVCRPPPPPVPYLKVGYVSSDFNNHPLAHLMQSVFGLHNQTKVKAHCYATTASDNSIHRQQIEREAPVFHDASSWSAEKLVSKISSEGIHILVNLNGYTRGARNEVFAARPAPIQMSFMGFAGTLGSEWCDYLLADETAVPTDTLRPWRRNIDIEDQLEDEIEAAKSDDWIYGENIIYCRDTFFCCDHRQSAPDCRDQSLDWEKELLTRHEMRKELFGELANQPNLIVMGNFNQLYKIEPTTFRTWLRILDRVPNAILWLLRFPDLGEQYLKKTALEWSSPEVASRVIFTDVAPKQLHISRARICDLFLDTPECNAHTTAADILWSGTPLLTLPRYKYKMCSRMAASILKGALPKGQEGTRAAADLIAETDEDYEEKAVRLVRGLSYNGHRPTGRLADLRKMLWKGRWTSALFDTKRWVSDLEEAYHRAWQNWVQGKGGDIWLEDRH